MTYFVNHLSLYSPKNRACKKLLDFISQFEHVLIKDDCSLDALSSLIEDRIREINTSHPKLRPICYSRNHSLQRITASVLPESLSAARSTPSLSPPVGIVPRTTARGNVSSDESTRPFQLIPVPFSYWPMQNFPGDTTSAATRYPTRSTMGSNGNSGK